MSRRANCRCNVTHTDFDNPHDIPRYRTSKPGLICCVSGEACRLTWMKYADKVARWAILRNDQGRFRGRWTKKSHDATTRRPWHCEKRRRKGLAAKIVREVSRRYVGTGGSVSIGLHSPRQKDTTLGRAYFPLDHLQAKG